MNNEELFEKIERLEQMTIAITKQHNRLAKAYKRLTIYVIVLMLTVTALVVL